MRRFEIVYEDASVVRGDTTDEYIAAPSAGIQFVVILYDDGSIIKHKALDEYEFNGAKKPGSWTPPENYERIKQMLPDICELLRRNPPPCGRRRR